MIDFFIEISNEKNTFSLNDAFFTDLEVYQRFECQAKWIEADYAKMLTISAETDDQSIYDSDAVTVLIYGYCFTRLNSELPVKKRLYALDLADIYKKYQQELTKQIKGSYSIVVYNKLTNVLNIFTDELNLRNLYYSQSNNKLLVSSSLSLFPSYNQTEFNRINQKSVLEYSLFDFDLANESFLEGVKTIPSGNMLQYSQNQLNLQVFWDIFNQFGDTKIEMGFSDALKKCEHMLKENMALYLSNPERTAFALTGGYDSRTNLALLGNKAKNHYYYSYGFPESYDVEVSKKIASKIGLNYQPIELSQDYANEFVANAETAILLGDGISEMHRANYVFAYKNFDKKYNHILTGLFGSELIKRPTSLGGYIDKNVKSLLMGENMANAFDQVIQGALNDGFFKKEIILKYKDSIFKDIQNNPYLTNRFNGARKFFFFICGIGIINYFRKEIKVERPWVENLHPFLDIEFIELLLKTPFPWIYNWDERKSLLGNLKIHKFYAWIITKNNPVLGNILSTHAYKPKLLLRRIYLPILIFQYFYYRKKIIRKSRFRNDELIMEFYQKSSNDIQKYDKLFNTKEIRNAFAKNMKEFTKLITIQWWMHKNKLSE